MSLRARLTASSALIVGVILALAGVVCFTVMREELRGQIDSALRAQGSLAGQLPLQRLALRGKVRLPPVSRAPGVMPTGQLIARTGAVSRPGAQSDRLPIDAIDRQVAAGRHGTVLRDRHAHGVHLRVLTVPLGGAGALVLGRSLADTDATLSRLRLVLLLVVLGGVAVAAIVSRVFARSVIAPITALTRATEHIERTGDLDRRVSTARTDEVGELAARFNAMLSRLEEARVAVEGSITAQRQLVADASHELRTPIASLRTNVEVLLAKNGAENAARAAMLSDIVEQTEELTAIISDLIELARGDQPQTQTETVDLAAIARDAVRRARRHAPHLRFEADVEPWAMEGSPDRLGRALNNVLDNAAKYSSPGTSVSLTLRGGEVLVRDSGPGVPADELPHIFDRFYRGRGNGATPGSGLGLAIVKQVVEAHDGTVGATTPGGGRGLRISLRFR